MLPSGIRDPHGARRTASTPGGAHRILSRRTGAVTGLQPACGAGSRSGHRPRIGPCAVVRRLFVRVSGLCAAPIGAQQHGMSAHQLIVRVRVPRYDNPTGGAHTPNAQILLHKKKEPIRLLTIPPMRDARVDHMASRVDNVDLQGHRETELGQRNAVLPQFHLVPQLFVHFINSRDVSNITNIEPEGILVSRESEPIFLFTGVFFSLEEHIVSLVLGIRAHLIRIKVANWCIPNKHTLGTRRRRDDPLPELCHVKNDNQEFAEFACLTWNPQFTRACAIVDHRSTEYTGISGTHNCRLPDLSQNQVTLLVADRRPTRRRA